MAKNYKSPAPQPKAETKPECDDPEHAGDRTLNTGDWWMCWPDFLLLCETCYKRREKIERIAEKHDDSFSKEQIDLFDSEDS